MFMIFYYDDWVFVSVAMTLFLYCSDVYKLIDITCIYCRFLIQ